ncbi:MAG: peptidylprolyl isomerase [Congregibacter sp.]
MRGLLREPLFHFACIGAALFAIYLAANATREIPITLSQAGVSVIGEEFQSLMGRPPTEEELAGLVQDYFVSEVLYREAQEQEVFAADAALRAALIEVMREAVTGELSEPDEALPVDYYADNIDRYYTEEALSVESRSRSIAPEDGDRWLAELAGGGSAISERTQDYPDYGASMLRGLFGQGVLASLQAAELERWIGPFELWDGWYAFRVLRRQPPRLLSFAEARTQVNVDYQAERVDQRVRRFVESLGGKYELRVEDG